MTKWDSSRPVPWRRLMREWVVYASIMAAVFLIFFPRNNAIGAIAGVLISGPLYLAFGAVMAKFGYTRKRLKELRAEAKEQATTTGKTVRPVGSDDDAAGTTTPRPRPAPTSRTAGSARPSSSAKRRR